MGRSPLMPILHGSSNSGSDQQQQQQQQQHSGSMGSSVQLHNSAAHNALGLGGSAGRGSAGQGSGAGLMVFGSLDQRGSKEGGPQQQQQQQQDGANAVGNEVNQGSTGSLEGCMTSLLLEESERAETWLITEYCDCGTLGNLVAKLPAPCPQDDERMLKVLLLLRDVAEGLKALHEAGVVHGDLNGRNVLVSASAMSPLGVVAKVADLGLSRTIKQHETHRTTNTCGTLSHTAPELLRYGRMGMPADVYAFGITMWELYTGQAAFRSLHFGQFLDLVYKHQQRPIIPAHMPEDYALLVEHCWGADPALRPTIATVLDTIVWMVDARQLRFSEAAAADQQQLETNHHHQASSAMPQSQSAPLPHAAAAAGACVGGGCSGNPAGQLVGFEPATPGVRGSGTTRTASLVSASSVSGPLPPRPVLLDTPVPARGQRLRRAAAQDAAAAAGCGHQDAGCTPDAAAKDSTEDAGLYGAADAANNPSDDSSSSSGEHDGYLTQEQVAASLGLERRGAAAAAAAAVPPAAPRPAAAPVVTTWGGPVQRLAPLNAAAGGAWKELDTATGMLQQRRADVRPSQDSSVDVRAMRGGLSEPLPLVSDGCNVSSSMEAAPDSSTERVGEWIV
ncbi:hypothetical protein OEZ85_003747 [Tetradesmus obliquus]|uniref:Protein kinase domain-containing protein n=1 Tax=Tetradesmus obliquus TaxID=3088 RepID=A0ABY8UDG9_TETOB|nr:hypothetical protein OEZ85_003747 [Tetradesmus obliquus]